MEIIDQTRLPHVLATVRLETLEDAARAIESMQVRGAPLIGATAAYGVCLALRNDASNARLTLAYDVLLGTRPTAVNLRWALDDMRGTLMRVQPERRVARAYERAGEICDEDADINRSIGEHGLEVIRELWHGKGQPERFNILTHCNAGWLATVDWGTALSPIYKAHDAGIPVHVWIDETRPRNQGASLTAWELERYGVDHTVVVDNVGGHLMQHGLVDMCIVGADRATSSGDVCNKIGTYLKALAARENGVPFYVALPGHTIDWTISNGIDEIPIEERDPTEVSTITGLTAEGALATVSILSGSTRVANYAFDVTPARYVTGLVTENGVCAASREGLRAMFPEKSSSDKKPGAGDC